MDSVPIFDSYIDTVSSQSYASYLAVIINTQRMYKFFHVYLDHVLL
jgi:hypothetical protein